MLHHVWLVTLGGLLFSKLKEEEQRRNQWKKGRREEGREGGREGEKEEGAVLRHGWSTSFQLEPEIPTEV